MKKAALVGIGMGGDSMTLEALEAINACDILIGSKRAASPYADRKKVVYSNSPLDAAELMEQSDAETFAYLVSGDPGFYSAASIIRERLSDCKVTTVPGISSVQAFSAKIGIAWQDAFLISAHGRDVDIAGAVRRNRLTFCLLGDAGIVAQRLCEAGLGGVIAHVGENLGTPCEKVYSALAADLIGASVSPLAIIAFVNESFDAGVHFGIPENRFERLAKIPMTKPEVRAVIMSKLKLKPTSICFDIGAGTGSVAVEMGLACHQGHICAIEKNPDAALLIKKNLKSFHLGNVSVIEGEAPCALSNLPRPDAVFVGGSGGKMKEIIRATLALNPLAELVASAATLETVHEAASAFDASGIEWEAFQISVSKSKPAGGLHLMAAQNPVTLICRASTP